jgi:hypothetical protein
MSLAEVKKLTHSCIESSTCHGAPRLLQHKVHIVVRIIWLCCFLASLSYCTYAVAKCFADYFKYDTTISISEAREMPTNYPAVTFCNLNPFNENNLKQYMQDKYNEFDFGCSDNDILNETNLYNCFYDIYRDAENNPYDKAYQKTETYLESRINKMKNFIANDRSANLSEIGFEMDALLLNCVYNGVSCSVQNFTKFWHNNYGWCYTFNDGSDHTVLQTNYAGSAFGLKLTLIVRKSNPVYLFSLVA